MKVSQTVLQISLHVPYNNPCLYRGSYDSHFEYGKRQQTDLRLTKGYQVEQVDCLPNFLNFTGREGDCVNSFRQYLNVHLTKYLFSLSI